MVGILLQETRKNQSNQTRRICQITRPDWTFGQNWVSWMASLYSATMVELGCSREQNCTRSIAGLGSRSQGDLEAAINSRFIQVFVIFDRLLLSFVSVEQLFTADTWHIGDCSAMFGHICDSSPRHSESTLPCLRYSLLFIEIAKL